MGQSGVGGGGGVQRGRRAEAGHKDAPGVLGALRISTLSVGAAVLGEMLCYLHLCGPRARARDCWVAVNVRYRIRTLGYLRARLIGQFGCQICRRHRYLR